MAQKPPRPADPAGPTAPQVATRLPENAYRELKSGETYVPMVPPGVTVPELTGRMFVFGLLMNIVFSVAATFLALKAGQGIETAIPISILAVGLSGFLLKAGGRASSILENVYVLSISTTSGYVAGGTCFTMPAIYILRLNQAEHLGIGNMALFLQITLVPLLGAVLGALFLIPFRRYFVKEMHGKLPFPEATATNEILVTGASGSTTQAWILIYSFILSALYTFAATALKLFSDRFTTGYAKLEAAGKEAVSTLAFGATGLFADLTTRVKAVVSMGASAYYLGLGFIIGLRYASIIMAGSILSFLVLTPLLGPLPIEQLQRLNPVLAAGGDLEASPRFVLPETVAGQLPGAAETQPLALPAGLRDAFAQHGLKLTDGAQVVPVEGKPQWNVTDKAQRRRYVIRSAAGTLGVYAPTATADEIFGAIPKNIGIGCIFTAGLLSILKMSGVIVTALRQALGALTRGRGAGGTIDRTDEDISYGTIALLGVVVVIVMAVFFRTVALQGLESAGWLTFISVVLALVITFLFTTVSAWAIAMISVTPISGMTVTTIIITAVLLMAAGLPKGDRAMLGVLLVGGVVCTGLSMAGGLITNFKIGYWTGASPRRITWNALAGSLVSAIFVCGTIMILAYKPGYTGDGKLDAPQANMMASALESFLGTGQVPWLMYGVGVMIALAMQLLGISPLAFGLGMYLPMYINVPILIGAFVATLVKKSTKDEQLGKARSNKGILLASGLIAGGAIMEVLVNLTAALDDFLLGSPVMVAGKERIVGTIMPFLDVSRRMIDAGSDPAGLARSQNWLGLLLFLLLCIFVYFDCRRAKPELAAGAELHG